MRISDLGLQQLLLSGFQRAQGAAQERQIQLSTGKQEQTYGGVGAATPRLLDAESVLARAGASTKAADVALSQLQAKEAALTNFGAAAGQLRARIVSTLATGNAELLLPEVETVAKQFIAAMNTNSGGVFVFAGVNGDRAPLAADALADFQNAPAQLFEASDRNRLHIDVGTSVDGGATALEVGADFAGILGSLAGAEAAFGPFAGTLTSAQRDFLVGLVAEIDAAAANVYTELGLNGVAQSQAADARARISLRRDQVEIAVSNIEDADLAEVIARLNQDQIAIEASARALSQASQLSLLNYL